MLIPGASPATGVALNDAPLNVVIPGRAGAIGASAPVILTAPLTLIFTWPPAGATAPAKRTENKRPGNSVASVIWSCPPRMLISLASMSAPPLIWMSPSLAKESTLMAVPIVASPGEATLAKLTIPP